MAQYQRSRDFTMMVNGQPVGVTATFTGTYGSGAFGGYVSNYDLKLLPCDVVSFSEFKSQLQSQIQAWVKNEINNTREAAGVNDAPGTGIAGNSYINDADQKAVELVENAKNCSLPVEQSQLNSFPTLAQSINQDGRGRDIGIDVDPGRSLNPTRDARNIEQPAGYPGVLDLAGRGIKLGGTPYRPSNMAETAAQDPVAMSSLSRGDQWSRSLAPSRAPFGWVFPSGRPQSSWGGESSDS